MGKEGEVGMTDRNTISQVIESLFEDWIDKNINVHPLAVENMKLLEADALELLKEPKSIPIIHEYRDTDLTVVQCGNCLAQLPFEKQKYCTECGSKIDWSILQKDKKGG